jgi:predicted nucleic-acid-binding Zn-ribbon protein
MAGISPISGAGEGAYNAYFHPGLIPKVNMPYRANPIDSSIPINPIKPVSVLPENNKTAVGWTIDSFKSILNFFKDTDSRRKNNVSEIQAQCPICRNREYTCSNDETTDGRKTIIPGHESAERVRQHEAEHLRIARMKADSQEKMVVSQRINTITEKCPECGETYVASGEAITETAEIITTRREGVIYRAAYNPSNNHPISADLRFKGIGVSFDRYG